jgi:hypothetical protein
MRTISRPRQGLVAALLLGAAFAAAAQSTARPRPPGTSPLEQPPPLPAVSSEPEPQVTIRKDGDQTVAEYRVNGKLYMQRVTTKDGRTYVLIDHKGDGTFVKQDNTLSPHTAVPQWVVVEF